MGKLQPRRSLRTAALLDLADHHLPIRALDEVEFVVPERHLMPLPGVAVPVDQAAQGEEVIALIGDIYFYDNMVMDQEIEIQKTSNTEGTIKSKASGDIMTYKNLTDTSVEFTGQGATNQKCDVMPSKVTLMGVDNLPFQIMSLFMEE